MNLNSKISIFIIGITTLLFLGLSVSNNHNKPQIKTISGDISQLDDLNIKIMNIDNSMYSNYEYILNQENINKEKSRKTTYNNDYRTDINLIDVTSGQDLVSHLGYKIDYSLEKNKINLIVDQRKNNMKDIILPSQGKDTSIDNQEIDIENINRRNISIETPSGYSYDHTKILLSNRYNNDLYIATQYHRGKPSISEDLIEIAKLNEEKNNLEKIKTINISKEIKEKYEYMNVEYSYKQKEKLYILMQTENTLNYIDYQKNMYLLEYDINTKKHEIKKIDTDKYSRIIDCKLENNNLNLVMSKENEGIEIINMKYDLNSKKIVDESKLLIEQKKVNQEERVVSNSLIKDNNIYLLVSKKYPYISWDNQNKIYVINKEKNRVSYEGMILDNLRSNTIEFEEK